MTSPPSSSVLLWPEGFFGVKLRLNVWEVIYPCMKQIIIPEVLEFIWYYRKSLDNLREGLWEDVIGADGNGYIAFVAYRVGEGSQEHGVMARISMGKIFGAMHREPCYHGYRNIHDYVRDTNKVDTLTPV